MTLERILDLDYHSFQDVVGLAQEFDAAERIENLMHINHGVNGDVKTINEDVDRLREQGFPDQEPEQKQDKAAKALQGLKGFLAKTQRGKKHK